MTDKVRKKKASNSPQKKKPKPRKAKAKTKPKAAESHAQNIPALGRPSEYLPEYDQKAFKLCLLGYTDKRLADFFGVSEQTVNAWKKKYPTFLESLKAGKEMADAQVAYGLFQRATGMEIPAVHVSVYEGNVTVTKYKEALPPDPNAAMKWLKNRAKDLWRDNIGVTDGKGGALGIFIHDSLRPAEEAKDD